MNARWKWTVACSVTVFIQTSAACFAAERYVFDVFDHERGLGNSTVTRLARDRQGALWVGTENGLYRYDGHRFLAFTTADGLPGNRITAIHESPDGTLWVGTLEGLAWKEGARFHKSTNQALKQYITPQGIASDGKGGVFIATFKGVAITSPPIAGQDVQVTFLPWPAAVPHARSSSVYLASPDELWFDCDVAICRWNGKDVRVWDSNAGVPPRKWDFFLKDRSGNLWARNRDAFIELLAGTDRFQPVGPDIPGPISFPPELTMDSDGRLLVTDNRGLAIGGPDGWHRLTEKQGLPASIVTAVTQDAEGSLWVGTYGAGLARWAGYQTSRGFTATEGLPGSSITSVLEDPPSGMWVGTVGGLSHGVFSKGKWEWAEVPIAGVGLVASLARAGDGALWMATGGHFVVRYDPVSHTSRRLGPFSEGPFDLRIDSAGRVWIADSGSVAVVSTQSRMQDLERIRPSGAVEYPFFTATLEDARGNLWLGSMTGLFRRSQGKWFHYDSHSGLISNRIIDLALSPDGDLWVTYSDPKGADRLRLVGDTVQVENWNRSKGLTSDRVNSIAFDRQGQLWVLNDHGAEVRRGNRWIQFTRADGLLTSGSVGRTFCASADGAIWIGSERGLSRFVPPETAASLPEPLRVRFSEIRIGNQTVDPELPSVIEATPQTFEARFSALLLTHGPEVQYRYRIAGIDDRWQETTQSIARFDYPRPGRYRLEVQARNVGQPWTGPTAALALEVRPRWYETQVFRAVLLALVCATLWLLEKYRKKRAAAARQALKQLVDERTAQLRESEERFRNMADNAPVLIWVSGPDKLFTFVNKTWLDFTGRTMEQELGSGWTSGIHPEDLQRCQEDFSAAFDARRQFQLECRLRRADGEYRSILCSGVPRFAPDGTFAGYIGSDIDITDLQSEERFRQLAENIDQVFWMFDLVRNRLIYVSPAFEKVWGRSLAELFQNTDWVSEAVHAEDRERYSAFVQRFRSGPAEESFRILRPDGSARWLHNRTFPVCDPEGNPYRVAGISEDITTHRELEEQLRQAHKMEAVGRLAGGVAHDFNNLLTVIGGYSRMLLDDKTVENPSRGRLEQILNAANRATILTRQLLAFSRRQVLQPTLINLNHLLTNMDALLRRLIGEHIAIETELDPAVSCIQADPHQIEQIMMNLAANARDAMPNGGRLRIQTTMARAADAQSEGHANGSARYVRLRISDTGCGMDARTRERAFEPFFTTKGIGKGTGLGLSIVYGIVQQNQGEIHLSSEPGQGTGFDLYFPAVSESEARSEAPANRHSRKAAAETILIVEDEPGVRGLVKQTLQQLGYRVLEASDGDEALNVAEKQAGEIHLLLTDVIMPLMNGRELATRLESIRPGTKVLFMSGYTDDVLAFHGLSQPQINFIQKPFTPSELAGRVEAVLSADKRAK